MSSLFVFSVCQLVRINFLFFCKYFYLSKKKRKNISNGIVFVFFVVEPIIDKLVCFYGEVNEIVHERTTLFFSVVSFISIPLSSLFVFSVCQLVRINFLFYTFDEQDRKVFVKVENAKVYMNYLISEIDRTVQSLTIEKQPYRQVFLSTTRHRGSDTQGRVLTKTDTPVKSSSNKTFYFVLVAIVIIVLYLLYCRTRK